MHRMGRVEISVGIRLTSVYWSSESIEATENFFFSLRGGNLRKWKHERKILRELKTDGAWCS